MLVSGIPCELNICPGSCQESDMEAKSFKLYERCAKRCFHAKFIPVLEMTESRLPLHVRDSGMFDDIRFQAKHTVRLIVSKQSVLRPDKYRTGKNATTSGTGWADALDMSNPRQVELCAGFNPKRVFVVQTARHVVYCEEEVLETWVRFFYDNDKDRRGEVKARGVKLLLANRDGDYCVFLCEVARLHEADKICAEWRKYDDVRIPRGLTGKFAFTVSHPHGLAQRVSVGEIEVTQREDVGSRGLKLLTHSCGDKLGLEPGKVMFFYIVVYLSEDRQDRWPDDLWPFLSVHKQEVVSHLINKRVIVRPTLEEGQAMVGEFNKLGSHCREVSDKKFTEKYHQATLRPIDEKYGKRDMLYDVIDELPHKMKNSPEFQQLEISLLKEIRSKYKNSNFAKNKDLSSWNKHVQYNVTTCPGSSGAWVHGFEFSGRDMRYFHAIHHGGKGECNVARSGSSRIIYFK